jgi:hypothetical protein
MAQFGFDDEEKNNNNTIVFNASLSLAKVIIPIVLLYQCSPLSLLSKLCFLL